MNANATQPTIDLNATVQTFNKKVNELITKLEQRTRNFVELANLERLRGRIRLLRSGGGERALIALASPFFIEHSELILNRDEGFFLKLDPKVEFVRKFGRAPDPQDEFVFSLVKSVQDFYQREPQASKDKIYEDIKLLLQCSAEYQLVAE